MAERLIDGTRFQEFIVRGINGQSVNTLTGLEIPSHDNIQLTYTGDNLTKVEYKVGSTIVCTLDLSYNGSDQLISVVKS